MFLAKPLRFRADLVCARSYAGRAPFFGAALFCALLTLRARSTREFRRATPLRELPPPASASARTQLASCPCKSRCVTLPCELLWLIPASESTLRSCHGSVDTVACDSIPAPVPQISLAQALDVRLTCGFVTRFASMLRSIRGGGLSRPARRVQAGLGEGHEPACHLRPQHVCLHLAHPSMYGATCPYLPFGCRPSRQCVVSMRRTSCSFLTHAAPPARRGRRIHAVRELWQGNRPARTKMPLRWQDIAICVPRALADGKMLAKCVPGRQSVASFSLHASKKWPRTGKSPVRGSISPPCIRNELALAGYARYASEKPRKQPFGNTPREDLARKGPFSLHGPLESCTARRSCHPLTLGLSATRRLR